MKCTGATDRLFSAALTNRRSPRDFHRYPTEAMVNPFQPSSESGCDQANGKTRLPHLTFFTYAVGTFTFSFLLALSLALPNILPRAVASAILLSGTGTALVSTVLMPISAGYRLLAACLVIILLAIQFVLWAIVALFVTGLDGTQ